MTYYNLYVTIMAKVVKRAQCGLRRGVSRLSKPAKRRAYHYKRWSRW